MNLKLSSCRGQDYPSTPLARNAARKHPHPHAGDKPTELNLLPRLYRNPLRRRRRPPFLLSGVSVNSQSSSVWRLPPYFQLFGLFLLASQPSLVRKAVFYSDPSAAVAGKDFDLTGRMDLAKVSTETLRLDEADAQYYVCGPERFMAEMIKGLREKGVDTARIHAEVFGAGAVPM